MKHFDFYRSQIEDDGAIDDGDCWEISDDTFQEVRKAFDGVKR